MSDPTEAGIKLFPDVEDAAAETPTENDPTKGPYDASQNGLCADGHPVNGYGRCAEDNARDYPNA